MGESNEDAVIRRCRYELGVELRLLNLSILTFAIAPPIRMACGK